MKQVNINFVVSLSRVANYPISGVSQFVLRFLANHAQEKCTVEVMNS